MTEADAAATARRIIEEAYRPEPGQMMTAYHDSSPIPAVGAAAPVLQPESRTVPPWASGIAVASIGIGAGVTGIGCGAWLVLNGLSAITLTGVLAIAAPFLGVAGVVTAVGVAVSKTKASTSKTSHIYQGTVINRTEVEVNAHTGMFSRSHTELHG